MTAWMAGMADYDYLTEITVVSDASPNTCSSTMWLKRDADDARWRHCWQTWLLQTI
jgi:hypothetical protein